MVRGPTLFGGGGFWLVLGNPEASAEARKVNAVVTIKATGCHDPAMARVTATAIGMVDGQRRDDDFARRCGYHKKRKANPIETTLQEVNQRLDRALEPNAAPSLDEMLMSHTAEFRVVPNEICQFPALLHKIAARKARDSILKP